jgi:hypothetical protein
MTTTFRELSALTTAGRSQGVLTVPWVLYPTADAELASFQPRV